MSILLDKIQQNISLASHTTFKIGGPARYFFIAHRAEEIIKAVEFAQTKNLPYFVLGEGSNVLVKDKGFDGLVIKLAPSPRLGRGQPSFASPIWAGEKLSDLVRLSSQAGLTGLEWAAGIPGSLGGALRGNAGAFGHSISELVREVKTLNPQLLVTSYQLPDINFSYRDSIFKHNHQIILSAKLKLKPDEPEKIQARIKKYLKARKQKQPLEFASAGCIFKNPAQKPAAALIEQCGLKGKKINQAMISDKHANFIINLDSARTKDVIKLIELIKKSVKQKFNINLEKEVEFL